MISFIIGVPTPDVGLIEKGDSGILAYGALFVIAIMAILLGLAIRSLSQRDELISEMAKSGAEAARETARSHLAVAVQLSRMQAHLGMPAGDLLRSERDDETA
ncbi:hypothetical protein [Alteriqipengyuania lutimaris]|uniref:Uncharacterized protein n=1 Tax=Alteriqipengyuania lutimaris TaxID=1538146 RepID=A0A395LGN9_9SPHN|nr:hypothetical protein [Alteriqipengyuania lutimaris]MBB3035368.1 hypothetical protein [Alteriqipengyuania lutimaris]RDS75952.1 hypothetical protein DL238_14870 [Alteriqipengyuania lutimaris]